MDVLFEVSFSDDDSVPDWAAEDVGSMLDAFDVDFPEGVETDFCEIGQPCTLYDECGNVVTQSPSPAPCVGRGCPPATAPVPTPAPCVGRGCGGRRLQETALIFSVRGSISALGLATASEFLSLVEANVNDMVASGSLAAAIEAGCGCNVTGLAVENFALSQAYPTIEPTPFPTTPKPPGATTGLLSWASLGSFPVLAAAASLLILGIGGCCMWSFQCSGTKDASSHDISPAFVRDFVASGEPGRSPWHSQTLPLQISLDQVYGGGQDVDMDDIELPPRHSELLRRLSDQTQERRRTGALAASHLAPVREQSPAVGAARSVGEAVVSEAALEAAVEASAPGLEAPAPALPSSWTSAIDPTSGRAYNVNTVTRETSWVAPVEAGSNTLSQQERPTEAAGYEEI